MDKLETIKGLEEICKGHYVLTLRGTEYCRLAFNRRIDCKYLAKELDENLLLRCYYYQELLNKESYL